MRFKRQTLLRFLLRIRGDLSIAGPGCSYSPFEVNFHAILLSVIVNEIGVAFASLIISFSRKLAGELVYHCLEHIMKLLLQY